MGTYMNYDLFTTLYNKTFVFDLEYVGYTTDMPNCYIWDIGIVHLATLQRFSITVDPMVRPLPKPFSSEFEALTEELLHRRNAVTFTKAWGYMLEWLNHFTNGPILWVAHNCFKADKMMFEVESKRHDISIPLNWYFFDSLIYSRLSVPKLPSYTLTDLYHTVMMKQIQHSHEALGDAVSLSEILRKIGLDNMSGPIYPIHCTSLQVVKWLGPSCEKFLFNHNICSLEQLLVYLRSEYSKQTLSGVRMKLKDFVVLRLTNFGIKAGNSQSIAESLIQKWIV